MSALPAVYMQGEMKLVIGTSGHVDHGKTEIVRALTGRETDRLREEKERGISIVLGFAPIDLGEGITAGIVDVPGHERFVKTMVSGAVGVDLALLVIAADEGVMPQTEEHFEVLRLLGVKGLVVAITKVDLADGDLVELVEGEANDLLSGTPFEGSPIVRTSAVTGVGLGELRERLREQALKLRRRETADFFRMPVDRAWTRSGIGTIVTGTAWSGEVRKGDELVVEPGAIAVRVREVHSFDRALEAASAGMRTALALHGIKVDEAAIGSQVVAPGVLAPAGMLNVRLEISRLAGDGVKTRQRIRFHHAASEIIGRIVVLEGSAIPAGGAGYAQLRLERQAVARRGDRFIIRSYSPQRVIGGGAILDPNPAKFRLHAASGTLRLLRALDAGGAPEIVVALAASGGAAGFSAAALLRYGLRAPEIAPLLEGLEREGRLVSIDGRIFDAGTVAQVERGLHARIEEMSSEHPLLWGVDREELRIRSRLAESPLFELLLERGRGRGTLFFKGGRVRAGSGERALSAEDRAALERLGERIRSGGYEFATKADLLNAVRDEKRLTSYLHILAEQGVIVRLGAEGYLHAEQWRRIVDAVRDRLGAGGELTVGDFKELFGFSRKFAVPVLEYLDREGFTRREGDTRRAGPRLRGEVRHE
jgi:selenocysteine-specific elongation factor